MKNFHKVKSIFIWCAVISVMVLAATAPGTAAAGWQEKASAALKDSLEEVGAEKGDDGLMVVTNAGYACVGKQTTQAFSDVARETTGCTPGSGSLLFVHASTEAPLWFACFNEDTHRTTYGRWDGDGFLRQTIDLHPGHILQPENWKKASEGPVKPNLFQVVSFCLVWSEHPSWTFLKSAELHNHICPGLNAGYLAGQYVRRNYPVEQGESYTFMAAPPACALDALQTMFDATAGKRSMYNVAVSKETLAAHGFDDVSPLVIVLRVNASADTCEGAVLGFRWEQACEDIGMDYADFSPPGGHSNPRFFISRARSAWKMAGLDLDTKLSWVSELKAFSGKASLADKLKNAGADPYAAILE